MKDSFYFPHDNNAFNDEKIIKLRHKLGMEGYGIFWMLIEKLASSSEARLKFEDLEGIAFDTHVSYERITDVLRNFGLFECDEIYFWSERMVENIKKRNEKSSKARRAIKIRWAEEKRLNKQNLDDTNVLRTYNERNTNVIQGKERKGKERKEEKRKENEIHFLTENEKSDEKKEPKKPSRTFEICDMYFRIKAILAGGKAIPLENMERDFVQSFMARHGKAAKLLGPYENEQIKKAMRKCHENSTASKEHEDGGWDWTLETVGKTIDNILNPNLLQRE